MASKEGNQQALPPSLPPASGVDVPKARQDAAKEKKESLKEDAAQKAGEPRLNGTKDAGQQQQQADVIRLLHRYQASQQALWDWKKRVGAVDLRVQEDTRRFPACCADVLASEPQAAEEVDLPEWTLKARARMRRTWTYARAMLREGEVEGCELDYVEAVQIALGTASYVKASVADMSRQRERASQVASLAKETLKGRAVLGARALPWERPAGRPRRLKRRRSSRIREAEEKASRKGGAQEWDLAAALATFASGQPAPADDAQDSGGGAGGGACEALVAAAAAAAAAELGEKVPIWNPSLPAEEVVVLAATSFEETCTQWGPLRQGILQLCADVVYPLIKNLNLEYVGAFVVCAADGGAVGVQGMYYPAGDEEEGQEGQGEATETSLSCWTALQSADVLVDPSLLYADSGSAKGVATMHEPRHVNVEAGESIVFLGTLTVSGCARCASPS